MCLLLATPWSATLATFIIFTIGQALNPTLFKVLAKGVILEYSKYSTKRFKQCKWTKRIFEKYAPKQNQDKIEKVFEMSKDKANLSFSVAHSMVMALYSPSFLERKKVEKMYENFLSKYQNEEAFPLYWTRGTTNKKKLQERRDHISGTKRMYQLHVRSQHAREEAGPKQGKGDTQANALAKGRQQTGRQGARCRSHA